MKINKIGSALVALLIAGVMSVNAQELVTYAEDQSPAIRVKYIGTATAQFVINPGTCIVATASSSNAYEFHASSNLTDFVGWLNLQTNVSGACYSAAIHAGIGADAVSNNFVNTTNILYANVYTNVAAWDTSAALHYDTIGYGGENSAVALKLAQILAQPTGTGKLTVDVYIDGIRRHEWIDVGEFYYNSDTNGVNMTQSSDINVALTFVGPLGVPYTGGIVIPRGKRCLVRATRATTATTGIMGAVFISD